MVYSVKLQYDGRHCTIEICLRMSAALYATTATPESDAAAEAEHIAPVIEPLDVDADAGEVLPFGVGALA